MDRNALHKLGYGVYVVTSGKEDKCNGQIANTVFQISSEPAIIAVSINKNNYTHDLLKKTGVFAVSVLSKNAPLKFIGSFGFRCGRDVNKFDGVNFKIGKTGARIVLDSVVAYIEAEVVQEVDAGTHTLFIGKAVNAEIVNDEDPMTYAFYHEVKRGTTPQSAPTYSKVEEERQKVKYRCTICNYIYDPEKGDPNSGVKPGTPFENLPEDWVCPICGATKDQFEKAE